jgi:hypothetical protein
LTTIANEKVTIVLKPTPQADELHGKVLQSTPWVSRMQNAYTNPKPSLNSATQRKSTLLCENSIVVKLLWRCHAHPELPLSLLRL